MSESVRISSIKFRNYKAFHEYSVTLSRFNVLVGPNNAGKSTVLGAMRILSAGIRRANARSGELIRGPKGHQTRAYPVKLTGLPISTENIFHNYDESSPATADFRLSNGNQLTLYFPERGECFLIPTCDNPLRTPSDFRRHFNLDVSFVPILGPVDHDEELYERETARLALLSHGASRNFRNIWYHFPEGFSEFRSKIQETWPGMDIEAPVLTHTEKKTLLHMFCPEERFPREIFWGGFGFQVWCQMLTFILQAKASSTLVIDEPDIYLHSDLQRQLVGVLRELGPQIVLATHSAEIIAEVEPQALLNINKRFQSARRVKDTRELQQVFQVLGSNLNPTLTQLAKTRRVVFVEGKDFQILSRFARKLGLDSVANRSDFAVIPVDGFNPQKVKDFAGGMEATLGGKLLKAAIFDRDYRPEQEVQKICSDLAKFCWWAVIHDRKELENFLLEPKAIARAIDRRLKDRTAEKFAPETFSEDVNELLMRLAEKHRNAVQARLIASRQQFERSARSQLDAVSISEAALQDFDKAWATPQGRMRMVSGKELLSELNEYLQSTYKMSVSALLIVECFSRNEIDHSLAALLDKLDEMRKQDPEDQPTFEFS